MAKQYNTRVVSVSLPNDIDDLLNKLVKDIRAKGDKITKSGIIAMVLYGFFATTIKEGIELNDSKEKSKA